MKKIFVALMLVMALAVVAFAAPGQHPAEKKVTPTADVNGDKLFEDLSEVIDPATDMEQFDVIVVFNEKMNTQGLQNAIGNFAVKYEYQNIDAVAGTMNKGQIIALSKMPQVAHVQLDKEVKAFLGTANTWYGTAKARTDWGVTGDRDGYATSYSKTDVVVAVIDTGIDAAHVDLDGGKVIAWKDYVNARTTAYDDQGHGTHCASIIAGTGEGNSTYKGVAPGAALIGLKVLNSSGSGSTSNIDAAVDWCITNKVTYNIKVISMSLGMSGSSSGTDSTSLVVNRAFDNGIVPVVAAGNEGPGTYTIGSPAAAAKAITVGAASDPGENGYFLAYFSSRGYTADGRVKPDLVAPGYNIMAAKANSTNLYVSMSGTSMATPFVAGTVALMFDANYALTPTDIKTKLTTTTQAWGKTGADIDYGNGRLQGYEAIKSAGAYTGTGPTVPYHAAYTETLGATGKYDYYSLTVSSTVDPIGITLIADSASVDFDLYLYNPSGTKVAYSEGTTRQETIGYKPTVTGTFKVEVYSYSGSGGYVIDVSGGSALTLTTDL